MTKLNLVTKIFDGFGCEELQAVYGDYVDGDLPNDFREMVDSHRKACPRCQEFVESYDLVVQLAKELKPAPFTPELKSKFRAKLSKTLGIDL